jgi:hypothetical protein
MTIRQRKSLSIPGRAKKKFFFFRTYRPYLGLSQAPIQWVVRTVFPLVEQLSLKLATKDFLGPRLRNS